MRIETSFIVPVPPERAWPLLLDVPRIAPCLPGASLTEDLGERRYKGQATVKVGPVQLTFSGEAAITDVDEANRTAKVVAKGNDTRGRGNASATTTFSLHAAEGGTRVDVATDLQMAGAVAQYGRAAGLLKEIANQIVGQFARNLREEILGASAEAATAPTTGVAAVSAESSAGAAVSGAAQDFGPSVSRSGGEARPQAARTSQPTGAPKHELSAFGLLWSALKAMAGRWLGRKST